MPLAPAPVKTHPANVSFGPQKARSETVAVGGNVDLFAWTAVPVLFEEQPKLAPEQLFLLSSKNSPSFEVRFPNRVDLLADDAANRESRPFQVECNLPMEAHRRHHHSEGFLGSFHCESGPDSRLRLHLLSWPYPTVSVNQFSAAVGLSFSSDLP
jgi:hypothetical protein